MKTVTLLLLALLLTACGSASPKENAWTACALFVERQYRVSFLEAEDYRETGVLRLTGEEYRVRIWYPEQKHQYECMMEERPNGEFQLLSLDVY